MIEDIRQELRRFGESTSIKGVSRIIKSHSRVVRIFWLVALLLFFSVLFSQVITLAINYGNNGVTNTFLLVSTPPNFPDVTICNFFPIADEKQFYQLYDIFVKQVEFIRKEAPDELKDNNEIWNFLKLIDTFNTNIPFLQEFGNNAEPEDFIVASYCYEWDLFNRKDCDKISVFSRPLQVCTTFKPNSEAAAITAVIFINDLMPKLINSYYNWIREPLSSGVKVMIHPRGTKPDYNVAVYVPPGSAIIIDVKQNNRTRLPHPYGSCSDRQQIDNEEENSPSYDQHLCISLCRQRQVIKHCGCLDNFEFFTDAEFQMGNYTFCVNVTKLLENPQMYTEYGGFTNLLWKVLNCSWYFVPTEDTCDCPVPCYETQYDVTSSSAHWPNIHYYLAFYDIYIRNDDRYREKFMAYEKVLNNSNGQSDAETIEELRKLKLIEENFLQVTVKMNMRQVQLVKDIPLVSWNTLISNLGGSLNLWLGVSIMTAAEIIELIYFLIKIAMTRKENKYQDTRV